MDPRASHSFDVLAGRGDDLARAFYRRLFVLAPELRDAYPANLAEARRLFRHTLVEVGELAHDAEELASFLRQLLRDHPATVFLLDHDVAVRAAFLGALEDVAGASGPVPEELRRAWCDIHDLVWSALRDAALAGGGPTLHDGTVVAHHRVRSDLAVVRVAIDPVPTIRAGQYVTVEIPQRRGWWRHLSPAGVVGADGVAEFHVRAVRGGWVSPALVAGTVPGDRWRLGPPAGHLTVEPDGTRDVLLVAGGTGVAPALAIAEELTRGGSSRRVTVFYGGRALDGLHVLDRLRALALENPALTVVPVVESPWGIEEHVGEVQVGTLAEVVPRFGAWADRDILLSGPPAMLHTMVEAMLAAGTPLGNLHHDAFW